jgi:type III secretion system FlhB-like substrate exporter
MRPAAASTWRLGDEVPEELWTAVPDVLAWAYIPN